MHIVIIPGFTGYPEEITFKALSETLESQGHTVTKVAWPHIPHDLANYNFTHTIAAARQIVSAIDPQQLILLGFSMGGIIATLLASEFQPRKLGLIVSPYQAGSEDDLAGKYKQWQQTGYRDVTSSKFGQLRIPFAFIEDARRYNALDYIQLVNCPVLFVVGEQDTKVPMTVTKQIFDKANQPKQWHQIPGMEHKYQYQEEMLRKVNEVIGEFVNQ